MMSRIHTITLGATAALLVWSARPAPAGPPAAYQATYFENARPGGDAAPGPVMPASYGTAAPAKPQPAPVPPSVPVYAAPQAAPQSAVASPQGPGGCAPGGHGGSGCGGLLECLANGHFCDLLAEGWQNARNGPQAAQSAAAPSYAADGTPSYPGGAAGMGAAGMGAAGTAGAAGGTTGGAFAGLEQTVGAGGGGAPPGVIGDMSPYTFVHGRALPGAPTAAGVAPLRGYNIPLRAFKIAENQSPRPMDRVFADFNFYDNVNRSYNERVTGDQIQHVKAYRQIYGFEKTFLGGQASFGMRNTINSLDVQTRVATLNGGTYTAEGNLSLFGKYVLLANKSYDRLLTAGLDLTFPTGPRGLGGYPNIAGFRDTQVQPFLGFIWTKNRFYAQGFSSVNAATDKHDTTLYFNDVAVGYYAYRNPDADALLTAIVPTFEVHVNTPLNHAGFKNTDPASTQDSVNFTFGNTFVLKRRSYLTFAYVTPVTGPKPFDYEIVAQFNYRFGGRSGGNRAGAQTALAPSPMAPGGFAPPNVR